jgi:AcrR family transcriptional regulator
LTETLSQRRREIIRQEIARAAIELFLERGFDAVTVDDIAAAAGTSPRTVFRYVTSKEDIVLDLGRRVDDRLLAALRARPADEGPIEALREAFAATSRVEPGARQRVLAIARLFEHVPAVRARMHGQRLCHPDGLAHRVLRELTTRSRDPRLGPAVIAVVAVSATEFEAWAAAGGRGDLSKRITEAVDVLMAGLGQLDRA